MKLRPSRRLSTENPTPRVSFVVPCYNYGHFLAGCIDSIVGQPGVETDVLIIDDASPDGSGAVAQELAERHNNVRAVVHETNRGHIRTYNEGLATVDSDYVVLLSADDLVAPGALARATALMEANPSVGLVYGHPQTFETTPPPESTRRSWWSLWEGDEWLTAQFRRAMSIVYSPEAVVRTSVHHEVGYYRPELPHSGDLELWLRIAAVAGVGRVNGPDQAYRRVHAQSMMNTHYATVVSDLVERDAAYESFLAHAGLPADRTRRLRAAARATMSREALAWAITAIDRLPASETDIEEAVAFARSINPEATSLGVWRELQSRRAAQQRKSRVPSAARLDAGARDIASRIRWRRWRYFGV